MINLIQKDFLLTKNKMLPYAMLCILLVLLIKLNIHHDLIEQLIVSATGVLFTYFNTIISFSAEEKYKASATIVTLPYQRKKIVMAKYASILLYSLIYFTINVMLLHALSLLTRSSFSGKGVLYGFLTGLLVHAFMIPFFIRYDYLRASQVMMLLVMLVGVLTAVFLREDETVIVLVKGIQQIKASSMSLVCFVLILASFFLSTNFYEKKEFF